MSLPKYYKNATLYPAIITVISTAIVSVYDNRDYHSEWLTSDAATVLAIMASAIYSLLISVFSLGLFLNKNQKIRDNFLLSFLSWFLLPYGWMALSITKTLLAAYNPSNVSYWYMVTVNTPFIVALAWTFIKYRRDQRNLNNL